MNELHLYQMRILRELLYKSDSSFKELNSFDLTSDLMSYHLNTLVDQKLVKKINRRYSLTEQGKEFANRMDTDNAKLEKQPKVSVLIIATKTFKNDKKYMIQTRLKEPYYKYSGFMTGKIRYGETVNEAASRELFEETGLEGDFRYLYLLHELVYDSNKNLLEDKFFNVVEAFNVRGKLRAKTKDGANSWLNEEEFLAINPKFHNEVDIYNWYKYGRSGFIEEKYYIEKF